MARPKRVNYATGAAGQERFKKALQAYLKKTKAAKDKANKITSTQENIKKQKVASKKSTTTKVRELTKSKASSTAKKTVAKKPVAKTTTKSTPTKTVSKTVVKKPVAKKPVAKKPVAKKPAGKVPAKKPLLSPKQKLQIKKGVKTAAKTTKKVVGSGIKKGKEVASNVKKTVNATKKALNKPSPTKRPTTRLQKLASKANKGLQKAGKYAKGPLATNVGSKLKGIGRGIAKDPKSLLKGAKGAGISWAAEAGTKALINRAFKPKGMTASEYDKKLQEMKSKRNIVKSTKKIVGGIANKFKNKKATTNNKKVTTNEKLKVNKKQGPTVKSINRTDYNVDTKSGLAAYNKAKNNLTNKSSSKPKKMHAIEKRNRKIFGDAHVDKLKAKHAAWKERRKKKKTLFR